MRLEAHAPTLERDLLFFLVFFGLAGALAWGPPAPLRIVAGIVFLSPTSSTCASRSAGGGEVQGEETLEARSPSTAAPPATTSDPPPGSASSSSWSGSARWSSAPTSSSKTCWGSPTALGIDALVLALILAPLATELPEKVNSFFWVREGKDALALGNVSGAMVFQSTIPIGIGLIFTDWHLSINAFVSVCLGLAGGLLAYESLHLARRFTLPA